ncbi:hypothetical protein ACFFQW_06420 [Umezawaea endophytica]|uniref:Uncharacterized protein n=1 Tax=Umezawaea endophytica TaxID=1654476 RepID=A0A9X3AH64_9PSEU|nr:hypothetical protein [Umezawaea endophytica]MCS7481037.1 hypothetical protein [Umezawaea endophytica]
MGNGYRYFAIVDAERGVDDPLAVVREWDTEGGFTNEEVFTSAGWESTNRLARLRAGAGHTDQRAVPIGPPAVEPPAPVRELVAVAPKKNLVKLAVRIGVPVVLLVIAVVGGNAYSSRTSSVGDCLRGSIDKPEDVRPVTCGSAADYKVVGKTRGVDEARATASTTCEAFGTTDAVFWEGLSGSPGTALCLEDLRNPGPRVPAVGDCVKGDLTVLETVHKVECGPEAEYKVLGKDVELTANSQSSPTCVDFPAASVKLSWERKGAAIPADNVLCLEDLKG